MRFFRKKPVPTLNRVEVSRSALLYNYELFSKLVEQKICPVLKSNAYGHGLTLVGKIMEALTPPFLVVDSAFEAMQLRTAKIKSPILILAPALPEQISRKLKKCEFAVSNLEYAEFLTSRKKPIHLEIDLGMSRMGFKLGNLPAVAKKLAEMKTQVSGVFGHFSSADFNEERTQKELETFKQAVEILESFHIYPKWIHASASAAALKVKWEKLNMLRLGIGLYGFNPSKEPSLSTLKPALKLKSTLIHIQELKPGGQVSYGGTFKADRPMRIGTFPLGYYEALPRSLSNKGPFLGRICMNHSMQEVSPTAQTGDEVEIYGNLEQMAQWADSIPYELLVRISESIRRTEVS